MCVCVCAHKRRRRESYGLLFIFSTFIRSFLWRRGYKTSAGTPTTICSHVCGAAVVYEMCARRRQPWPAHGRVISTETFPFRRSARASFPYGVHGPGYARRDETFRFGMPNGVRPEIGSLTATRRGRRRTAAEEKISNGRFARADRPTNAAPFAPVAYYNRCGE